MSGQSLEDLLQEVEKLPAGRRHLVGIAGPPGSGKSTVSEAIVARLNSERPGRAAILPMDGYHYDDMLLSDLGRLDRKGAPDTFDVDGFAHMLDRLKRAQGNAIAVPVFDRDIEIARAGARLIAPEVEIVVVEGNYILLDAAGWRDLGPFLDLTVRVEVPEDELRRRLVARWQGYGLDPDAVSRKVEGNDIPNGRRVNEQSRPADFVLANV